METVVGDTRVVVAISKENGLFVPGWLINDKLLKSQRRKRQKYEALRYANNILIKLRETYKEYA